MGPLSAIVSNIAVTGAGGAIVRGLKKLDDLRNVPSLMIMPDVGLPVPQPMSNTEALGCSVFNAP